MTEPAMFVPRDEFEAMSVAYRALTSQPAESWLRMLHWLNARVNADMQKRINEQEACGGKGT